MKQCLSIEQIILLVAATATLASAASQPNIIFILADDWGIGDVKTYGGERCKN